MADRLAKLRDLSPALFMGLWALLCPGTAHSALPPPPDTVTKKPASNAKTEPSDEQHITWAWPPIRYGGSLAYNLRYDISDTQTSMQSGQTGTFRASTNGFIWQPWFARITGTLGLTLSRSSSETNQATSSKNSSKGVFITGSGQLSVLDKSRYPFEAHFTRTDSRVTNDLALANGYASQQYGFTQRYLRTTGDAMLGWNRNTQTSDNNGRYQQDNLQLSLSQSLKNHRLQLVGNYADNARETTDEQTVQSNLTLHDNYTPNATLSVASTANLSSSGYRLLQGNSDTQLLQLSSMASWRPTSKPFTVTGGVRLFALELDRNDFAATTSNTDATRIYNANANIGASYTVNRFFRINAGANINMAENKGEKNINSNQSLSASYSPDAIELGSFRYNWSTSGAVNNQSGTNAGHQETLQLSHNIGRSYPWWAGSTLSVNGGQSVSAMFGNASSNTYTTATQRLTNNASLSWNISRESRTAQLRVSVSDSRALDGQPEFFQMINLQASGNLPAGRLGSWTGNLTIQATRQSVSTLVSTTDPFNPYLYTTINNGVVTSSSGSISYQNQQFFGVRRLNFTSDLRLNSQALLPLLGSEQDRETAAWQNRLNYSIGRTQLQLNMVISSTSGQKSGTDPVTGVKTVEGVTNVNKSIFFSVTRSF